ncbi:hypothetical protein ABTH81_23150, partial [Acinetobacter baumannii]
KAGYQAHQHIPEETTAPASAKKQLPSWWPVAVSAALSLPLLLPMLLAPLGIGWSLAPLGQWLLATPVQFWLGWRFYH